MIAVTESTRDHRIITCTCEACGLAFRMQLRYVWECRNNGGPYCPNGCNESNDEASGLSTVYVAKVA